MTTASFRCIEDARCGAGGNSVSANNLIVFVVAVMAWGAFFYAMDTYVMELQGLPVGADMMPV